MYEDYCKTFELGIVFLGHLSAQTSLTCLIPPHSKPREEKRDGFFYDEALQPSKSPEDTLSPIAFRGVPLDLQRTTTAAAALI